jgi:hypothetical protein
MPDVYIFQSGQREVYFFTAERNANLPPADEGHPLRFIRAESINRGEQRIGVNSDDMFDGSSATAFICNAENFASKCAPTSRRQARTSAIAQALPRRPLGGRGVRGGRVCAGASSLGGQDDNRNIRDRPPRDI